MVTNKTQLISLAAEKRDEVRIVVQALKTSDKKSRGNQLYQKNKELKYLSLVSVLLKAVPDNFQFTEDMQAAFIQLTTLASEHTSTTPIVVEEGDKITELLEKYKDRRDLYRKLQEACAKRGLEMDFAGNTIVKTSAGEVK